MARVTIQDCLPYVENRFDLCFVATKRAIQLLNDSPAKITLNPNRPEKPTVIALREIAQGYLPEESHDRL